MSLTPSFTDRQSAISASALVSASFTPGNGDVIVVKCSTWDTGTAPGTPSGGSQSFTSRVDAAPGGFRGRSKIYTAVVSGSPGSMAITLSAPSGSCNHDMVVEVWPNAQLAGTPATISANGSSSEPSAVLATVADGSVVSWCSTDVLSRDPATRAYRSSATETGLTNNSVGANAVFYHAYQQAATAGNQTLGLTAPLAQTWTLAGIEIQAAPAGTTGAVSTSIPLASTVTVGAVTDPGSVATTVPVPSSQLAATATDPGVVAASIPVPTGSVAAIATASGEVAGELLLPGLSSAAVVTSAAELASSVPVPAAVLNANGGSTTGQLTASAPVPTTALAGGVVATGIVLPDIPGPVAVIGGGVINQGLMAALIRVPVLHAGNVNDNNIGGALVALIHHIKVRVGDTWGSPTWAVVLPGGIPVDLADGWTMKASVRKRKRAGGEEVHAWAQPDGIVLGEAEVRLSTTGDTIITSTVQLRHTGVESEEWPLFVGDWDFEISKGTADYTIVSGSFRTIAEVTH